MACAAQRHAANRHDHDAHDVPIRPHRRTLHVCSMLQVYGALPPDVRRRQAALFNADSNAYSVLVASDAIGQGLNLSIQRVVFHAMSK